MAEESKLQSKIINDLEWYNNMCVVYKLMKINISGLPDICFHTVKTGAVYIEVKAPGKKPSHLQTKKLELLRSCGAKAYWCDSWEGWVEIKKILGIHDRNEIINAHLKNAE